MDVPVIVYLCAFAFLAGFIDAIAGGGGLIQVPALFIFLPNVPLPALLGTTKLASIAGTSASVFRYSLSVKISWKTILPAAIVAFACAFLGARAVSHLNPDLLKPMIILLLIIITAYTFIKKDFGAVHAPNLTPGKERLFGILTGAAIGFYDGFFGPGTGSFLIFMFIGIFGFSFLYASASAKVVNVGTNLSALIYFAVTDNVLYAIGIPMALCNIAGSLVGSKIAITKGNKFIRYIFLAVVVLILGRLLSKELLVTLFI